MTAVNKSAKDAVRTLTRSRRMAKHEHGSMDTEVQEKTFEGFLSLVTKTAVFCVVALVFIALVNA
jgi:hypothetical protein